MTCCQRHVPLWGGCLWGRSLAVPGHRPRSARPAPPVPPHQSRGRECVSAVQRSPLRRPPQPAALPRPLPALCRPPRSAWPASPSPLSRAPLAPMEHPLQQPWGRVGMPRFQTRRPPQPAALSLRLPRHAHCWGGHLLRCSRQVLSWGEPFRHPRPVHFGGGHLMRFQRQVHLWGGLWGPFLAVPAAVAMLCTHRQTCSLPLGLHVS